MSSAEVLTIFNNKDLKKMNLKPTGDKRLFCLSASFSFACHHHGESILVTFLIGLDGYGKKKCTG